VLIDDLLKRTMDVNGALLLAWAEIAAALPLAAIGAYLIEEQLTSRSRPSQPAIRFRFGRTLALLPVPILVVAPLVLILLSLGPSPILDVTSAFTSGPTHRWYAAALADPGIRSTAVPSFSVWAFSGAVSIVSAMLASVLLLSRPALRRAARWFALLILFVPQNALAVLLFFVLSRIPLVQAATPPCLLAGCGQAIPGAAMSFLLLDRTADGLVRSLRLAQAFGASAWKRIRSIAVPALLPSIISAFVATALITLDDIVFVRYLPLTPVNTVATELFARARYSGSPDLAATCVLVALFVFALLGLGLLAKAAPRIRRKLFLESRAKFAIGPSSQAPRRVI